MKQFECRITDEMGLHARPAGLLAKAANQYKSEVTLSYGGKTVSCRRLIAIMSMQIKKDCVVEITVSGEDEEEAFAVLKDFSEKNL